MPMPRSGCASIWTPSLPAAISRPWPRRTSGSGSSTNARAAPMPPSRSIAKRSDSIAIGRARAARSAAWGGRDADSSPNARCLRLRSRRAPAAARPLDGALHGAALDPPHPPRPPLQGRRGPRDPEQRVSPVPGGGALSLDRRAAVGGDPLPAALPLPLCRGVEDRRARLLSRALRLRPRDVGGRGGARRSRASLARQPCRRSLGGVPAPARAGSALQRGPSPPPDARGRALGLVVRSLRQSPAFRRGPREPAPRRARGLRQADPDRAAHGPRPLARVAGPPAASSLRGCDRALRPRSRGGAAARDAGCFPRLHPGPEPAALSCGRDRTRPPPPRWALRSISRARGGPPPIANTRPCAGTDRLLLGGRRPHDHPLSRSRGRARAVRRRDAGGDRDLPPANRRPRLPCPPPRYRDRSTGLSSPLRPVLRPARRGPVRPGEHRGRPLGARPAAIPAGAGRVATRELRALHPG